MITENMEGPVLILEDDAEWRCTLEKKLEEEGILTITYSDPATAIDDVRDGLKYKVVLVDLAFPSRYSGYNFIRESKKLNPSVPAILISGWGGVELQLDSVNGSWQKSKDHVDKLIEMVKRYLQTPRQSTQA